MRVLILYVKYFNFADDAGKKIKGSQIHFIEPQVLLDGEDEVGVAPVNLFSADFDLGDFDVVPGFYDFEFTTRRGAKGKLQQTLTAINFVQPVNKLSEVLLGVNGHDS